MVAPVDLGSGPFVCGISMVCNWVCLTTSDQPQPGTLSWRIEISWNNGFVSPGFGPSKHVRPAAVSPHQRGLSKLPVPGFRRSP